MNQIIFLLLMLIAAIIDIRKRMVPDSIWIMTIILSLVPPDGGRVAGILAALPLFIAGITVGGIGGGDVKLMGAIGMMLGFEKAVAVLIIALASLLAFHGIRKVLHRYRQPNSSNQKEQAYPLVPFLMLGSVIVMLL